MTAENNLIARLDHYTKHKIAHAALLAGIFFGQFSFLNLYTYAIESNRLTFILFCFIYSIICLLGVYELNRFNHYRLNISTIRRELIRMGVWAPARTPKGKITEKFAGFLRKTIRHRFIAISLYLFYSFLLASLVSKEIHNVLLKFIVFFDC